MKSSKKNVETQHPVSPCKINKLCLTPSHKTFIKEVATNQFLTSYRIHHVQVPHSYVSGSIGSLINIWVALQPKPFSLGWYSISWYILIPLCPKKTNCPRPSVLYLSGCIHWMTKMKSTNMCKCLSTHGGVCLSGWADECHRGWDRDVKGAMVFGVVTCVWFMVYMSTVPCIQMSREDDSTLGLSRVFHRDQ